jgi:hypothetical protein
MNWVYESIHQLIIVAKSVSRKRPTQRSALSETLETGLAGDLLHLFGVHIEVRIDVLGVVEVF